MKGAQLATRIAALPRPTLIGLDVDGTLAPMVDDPQAARVPEETKQHLEALLDVPDMSVALITGRDAASLGEVIALPRAWRAVEHGRLVIPPGASTPDDPLGSEDRRKLDAFEAWVEANATGLGGRLERKAAARVLHVRALTRSDPDRADRLVEAARREAVRLGLHVREGRAIVEADLGTADKATAVEEISAATGARGCCFAGDDLTDLPAIAHVSKTGGIGIFVHSSDGPPAPPDATATVEGVIAFAEVLSELVARVRA